MTTNPQDPTPSKTSKLHAEQTVFNFCDFFSYFLKEVLYYLVSFCHSVSAKGAKSFFNFLGCRSLGCHVAVSCCVVEGRTLTIKITVRILIATRVHSRDIGLSALDGLATGWLEEARVVGWHRSGVW